MNRDATRRGFAARPADPERWIKVGDGRAVVPPGSGEFTARLTVDITPALRGRIKIAAFQRGITVAEMLRDLLTCEFPAIDGEEP